VVLVEKSPLLITSRAPAVVDAKRLPEGWGEDRVMVVPVTLLVYGACSICRLRALGSLRTPEARRVFITSVAFEIILATLPKQGRNLLDALTELFSGNPQSPLPRSK
jgi:hypothetical protein